MTIGSVAGKLFPLRVRPMTPASLSTIGSSKAGSRSAGISMPEKVSPRGSGFSPMVKAANMPFTTDVWLWRWAWYIPIAGSSATNS
jgi:hypothetical protein